MNVLKRKRRREKGRKKKIESNIMVREEEEIQ